MSFGTEQFRVLPEHIKLLQSAYTSWNDCEYGAASIDCKRPYGSSSVTSSILRVLGIKPDKDGRPDDAFEDNPYEVEEYFKEETIQWVSQLHMDTEIVLQIFLRTGSMLPGLYESEKYRSNWVRVDD